ncbi:serine/threonine-protein kinase [Actinomadura sp. SCN-SB]|uniref:serine/threonine-protein kinase n=1 Tax=Actinomadura sp. SCN-SB TaxID=3373092 RepID=UPI00374FF39E
MITPRPLRANDPGEVGGFRIEGRIGEGGQGVVYRGAGPSGEPVAVKILHRPADEDPKGLRLFRRELRAVRRVAPFCTARILAADPAADPPYVVSEYIDGPSLRDAVRRGGPLDGPELERLAIGTATALAAIHEAGVVHRDLKPGNVLLAPDGPRVIDFGIARPPDATVATATGALGTPGYMAPEQLGGAPAGPWMDLFAWGCTIAYAANGRPPFGKGPLPAVVKRTLHDEPDLGALTGTLRELVASCLDKDHTARPTARRLLRSLLGEDDRTPAPDLLRAGSLAAGDAAWDGVVRAGAAGPSRTRLVVGASAAAAVLTVAAVAVVWWPPGGSREAERPRASASAAAGRSAVPSSTPSTTPPTSPDATGRAMRSSPALGLEIWQDGKRGSFRYADAKKSRIESALRRGPFEVRVAGTPGITRICFGLDDSIFTFENGAKARRCRDGGPGIDPGSGPGSGGFGLARPQGSVSVGYRILPAAGGRERVELNATLSPGSGEDGGGFTMTVFTDKDGDGRYDKGEYEYVSLLAPS